MMIFEQFRNEPNFPFDRYYESASQYTSAMKYWFQVLRSAPSFVEKNWMPRERPVELEQDMYLGKVIDIVSILSKKEINLQTASVLGSANMLFKENSGLTDDEYKEQKVIFGENFGIDDKFLKGITYEEAFRDAQTSSKESDILAWVEKAMHWQPDPKHREGGYEMEIERLIVTAEISERAEAKVIQALELFLQPGPAKQRVNSVFAPSDRD